MDSHILAYDNLSGLSQKLSDALCRVSTGAGNKERKYYTNQGQVRFPDVSRPMIRNGIGEIIAAPDLLDRSIVLYLQHIENKRAETTLWRDFNSKSGRIFAGALDCMVQGVRNLPSFSSAVALDLQAFMTRFKAGLWNQNFFTNRAPSNAARRKSNHRAMYQCPFPAID